jgi:hypothetical protein
VDFKLENVLVSLHSLKTMGLGPFGTSAPLFLRNGELLGHSPILKKSLKPGLWVLIAVGGANIQIVHFFYHGYLDEEKSMMHSFSYFWRKIFDRHGY